MEQLNIAVVNVYQNLAYVYESVPSNVLPRKKVDRNVEIFI